MSSKSNIDKSIFILGCHKSGTTLLRSIFDGHTDLFIVPFESHFFQKTNFWVDYEFRKTTPSNKDYAKMKASLFEWVKDSNSIENKLADGFTNNKWNLKKVSKVLNSIEVDSNRDLLELYFISIYEGINNEKLNKNLRFVEKSVENAEFAMDVKKLLPNSQFIHVLRNPYSNLVSLRKYMALNKYKKKEKIPFYKNAIKAMHNSYYYLYKNKRLLDNYSIILYEDLVSKPHHIIKRLCEFLRIPFQEILLTPTHLGENWGGNSTTGEKFQGISDKNLTKWKSKITNYEIHLVNNYFDFVLDNFGYDKISNPHHGLYRKQKGEGIKEYIANRLYFEILD